MGKTQDRDHFFSEKTLQYDFLKMRGGGQRPHGAFPNIHAFWQGMVSLTLVSDEDPVPLPGALHPGAVQGVVRLLLQLLKVKFKELEASIGAQF